MRVSYFILPQKSKEKPFKNGKINERSLKKITLHYPFGVNAPKDEQTMRKVCSPQFFVFGEAGEFENIQTSRQRDQELQQQQQQNRNACHTAEKVVRRG